MRHLKIQRKPTEARAPTGSAASTVCHVMDSDGQRRYHSLLALVQQRMATGLWTKLRQCIAKLIDRSGYALALLPVFTDRIDTGHWPQHPKEFSTEIVIGLLILIGVHYLYRRIDSFRTIANQDPLTGLGNRRDFVDQLVMITNRSRQSRMPFALAYIDLNDFKLVNDTYGHAVGDQVLEAIAGGLRRSIRSGLDYCFRLGGDEFAVLLSHTDAAQGLKILKRGLQDTPIPVIDGVSCAIGIVSGGGSQDLTHISNLVARADALMYRAKAGVLPHSPCGAELFTQLDIGYVSCGAAAL